MAVLLGAPRQATCQARHGPRVQKTAESRPPSRLPLRQPRRAPGGCSSGAVADVRAKWRGRGGQRGQLAVHSTLELHDDRRSSSPPSVWMSAGGALATGMVVHRPVPSGEVGRSAESPACARSAHWLAREPILNSQIRSTQK